MTIEHLELLRERAGAPHDEIAKRMGITLAQYTDLLSGKTRFRRLYTHALDKASLSFALERRDPSLMSPLFQRQALRIATFVLQGYEPASAPAPAKVADDAEEIVDDA